MDHMIIEHEMKIISVSDSVSGRLIQWTFRINLPASDETAIPSHLFYYISTMDNRQDDTDVSDISDDEHDGDVNKVHISDAEDDTDVSEISNDSDEFDNRFNQTHMLRCDLCDKTFFDENELDWHIRQRHSQSVGPMKQKKSDSNCVKKRCNCENVQM